MNDDFSQEYAPVPTLALETAGGIPPDAAILEISDYPAEDGTYEFTPGAADIPETVEGCGGDHEAEESLVFALDENLTAPGQTASSLATIIDAIDPGAESALREMKAGQVFNSFVYGDQYTPHLRRLFQVVAYPGEVVPGELASGDILLRRGAEGETYVSVISSGELIMADQAQDGEVILENMRNSGRYAAVIEGGPFPHRAGENYHRRITNAEDLLPKVQLLLRPAAQLGTAEWLDSEIIPSSGLRWNGATAAQLAFMRAVYDAHVARSSRSRTFQADVPAAELGAIEDGRQARRAAAQSCRDMLADARRAIAADPAVRARVTNVGITSGYRSATNQFNVWQRNFPRYYNETSAERRRQTGGEHGPAAIALMVRYVGGRVAAPGFSMHNDGRAVDLTTTESGRRLAADTASSNIRNWRASWFYNWLTANAGRFNFHENTAINEPWHWEYRPGSGPARPAPTQPTSSSTAVNWCQMRNAIAAAARAEERRWTTAAGAKILESAASHLPVLEQYWRATPGYSTPAAAAAAARDAAANNLAWSAAFICFVMRTAGIQAAHGFVFSGRHLDYVVGALRNRERSDQNRVFWLADHIELQAEAIPKPGDLLCFNRRANGRMTTHSYSSLRRDFWMGGNENRAVRGSSHTSIVVDVVTRGSNRFVQFIGGNEQNSVRVREIQLNASGGISNPGAFNIFGIIKMIKC